MQAFFVAVQHSRAQVLDRALPLVHTTEHVDAIQTGTNRAPEMGKGCRAGRRTYRDAGYLGARNRALACLAGRLMPTLVTYLFRADPFEGDRLGQPHL